jgi:hypothetical protein
MVCEMCRWRSSRLAFMEIERQIAAQWLKERAGIDVEELPLVGIY